MTTSRRAHHLTRQEQAMASDTSNHQPLRGIIRTLVPQGLRSRYWRWRDDQRWQQVRSGDAYEPHVSKALKRYIRPGFTCLDVGANVGLLSVLMADCTGPRGRVYAFEAHPENADKLRANVRRTGLEDRIDVIHRAVNDGLTERVTLYAGRNNSAAEWNILGHDINNHVTHAGCNVPAVALDDYFDAQQRIDLVKIDVEGAESQVLMGMARIIWQWSPVMVIECHSDENWRACANLADYGYRFQSLADGRLLDPAASYHTAHFVAAKAAVKAKAG